MHRRLLIYDAFCCGPIRLDFYDAQHNKRDKYVLPWTAHTCNAHIYSTRRMFLDYVRKGIFGCRRGLLDMTPLALFSDTRSREHARYT